MDTMADPDRAVHVVDWHTVWSKMFRLAVIFPHLDNSRLSEEVNECDDSVTGLGRSDCVVGWTVPARVKN